MEKIKILGMAGSLRKGSYNKALIRAAEEILALAPRSSPDASEVVELEVADIATLPLYNNDLLADMPPIVKAWKEKIKGADAILIATPEYNYSFPGVLKNAIDWASRPYTDNSFEGKPVAIMGASNGLLGTSRAQYHLRQVLVALNTKTLNRPEIMVGFADKKIDENGRLTDEDTRGRIKKLLEALVSWTLQLKK